VEFIDYAKGWCIVLVVLMHSTLGLSERVGEANWLGEFIAFAKPFRMPDFFLIAGLFAMRSLRAPLRRFLDGKIVHFAYFYVLWMTIQILMKRGGLLIENPTRFGSEYLYSLVEPLGTLRFIYLLPIMYAAARLLRSLPTALVLILAAAVRLLELHTGSTVIDYFSAYFVFFLAGVRLSPRILSLAGWCGAHPLLTGISIAVWAVANACAVHAGLAGEPLLGLALGLAGGLAVVAGSALLARGQILDPLRYAGQHSLPVYLAFFLPMAAVRTALIKAGWTGNVDAAALVITAAAIATPLALQYAFQQTPLKFLFERPAGLRLRTRFTLASADHATCPWPSEQRKAFRRAVAMAKPRRSGGDYADQSRHGDAFVAAAQSGLEEQHWQPRFARRRLDVFRRMSVACLVADTIALAVVALGAEGKEPAAGKHARDLHEQRREIADVGEDIAGEDQVEAVFRRRSQMLAHVPDMQCIIDAFVACLRDHPRREIDAFETIDTLFKCRARQSRPAAEIERAGETHRPIRACAHLGDRVAQQRRGAIVEPRDEMLLETRCVLVEQARDIGRRRRGRRVFPT
jgi:uncharacterized membrane protein YcfT